MKPKMVQMVLAAAWLVLPSLAPLSADEPTLKTTLKTRVKRVPTMFVAFSPDGKTLASRGIDTHTWIWDLATGMNVSIGESLQPAALFFSPDGKTLILLHEDVFQICDVASGKHVTMRKVLDAVPFSPDGKSQVVLEKKDLKLRTLGTAFDPSTGQNDVVLTGANTNFGNYPYLAFSPDGQTLATRNNDGDVMLWDVAAGKNTATLPQTAGEWFLFSPDGKTLAAASGSKDWYAKRPSPEERTPKLWDVASGKKIAALEVGPHDYILRNSLVFSPDGKTLAVGRTEDSKDALPGQGKSMRISMWDAATGKIAATIEESSAGLTRLGPSDALVVFSPDGKTLAAPCNDGTVKLYDVAAAKLAATIKAKNYMPGSFFAVFSPDGTLLATTNEESGISLWNVPGAKPPGK